MRLRLVVPITCVAITIAPASASALGTVALASGESEVSFAAALGVANDVTITATPGSVSVTDASDTIQELETACTGDGTHTVTCTASAINRVSAQLMDLNDRFGSTGTLPVDLNGGDGGDELTVLNTPPEDGFVSGINGAAGDDRITSGDGPEGVGGAEGTDTISTGSGPDSANGGPGDGDVVDLGPGNDFAGVSGDQGAGDVYEGGPGLDLLVTVAATLVPPVDVEVDLAAGTLGGTNTTAMTMRGFEDAQLVDYRTTNVKGTAASNAITTLDSADTVDPGAGSDFVRMGDGGDRALVRDGFPDSVRCGPGGDSVEADQLDTTSDCETVDVAQVRPATTVLGPPGCALSAVRSRVQRKTLLRRGLAAAVTCVRPASLEVRLLARAAPRRNGIGLARAGDVVLAERTLALGGERRSVRLRVAGRLRSSIPRSAPLRVQVVARDAFGNVETVTKRVRVVSRRPRSR